MVGLVKQALLDMFIDRSSIPVLAHAAGGPKRRRRPGYWSRAWRSDTKLYATSPDEHTAVALMLERHELTGFGVPHAHAQWRGALTRFTGDRVYDAGDVCHRLSEDEVSASSRHAKTGCAAVLFA